MGKLVDEAGGHPKVEVLDAAIPVEHSNDPHWWHDPRNAIAAVREIRDALVRADPAHAAAYRRNAAAYTARLHVLDQAIQACIARVPGSRRKLVTDHDAFGFLAGRYGITVVGAVIPSQTTQAQPSARDTARLIALIKREHVKAVFPESSMNAQLAEQIARETGATAKYHLYGDTLGPKGTLGASYVSMERANADAMVHGMTGGRVGCT
jgi:ABC-type Zn uptake system ZnuABC Zn-binding protein ZnuA